MTELNRFARTFTDGRRLGRTWAGDGKHRLRGHNFVIDGAPRDALGQAPCRIGSSPRAELQTRTETTLANNRHKILTTAIADADTWTIGMRVRAIA